MRKLVAVLKMLLGNPLNKRNRISALVRFFKWQIGSKLVAGKVLIPWINDSRIFAGHRMSGSAGCAYSGLHEFEEMAFVLHCLRKEDLFLDVGANVGVFTVLAGGAVGASCIAVEPGDESNAHLLDNIVINRMEERVEVVKACVSDEDGTCQFATAAESTWSHIAASGEQEVTSEIATRRIDAILSGKVPLILKIDVEGYEKQAVEGAVNTLSDQGLKAVLLEIGVHSLRYGVEPMAIHEKMLGHGFLPFAYEPFTRTLSELKSFSENVNTLYLRDMEFVKNRIQRAKAFHVFSQKI